MFLSLLVSVLAMGSAPATPVAPVLTVDRFDIDRYLGDWHEIDRYPNCFQRKCTSDVRAVYARRDDGRISVVNRCRTADGTSEAEGVARVEETRTNAKLKVRFAPAALSFLPFVWGDYWIIGLAPDYSWAVVGSPDRKYLWVLARRAQMDDVTYAAAIETARRQGFDPAKLVRSP